MAEAGGGDYVITVATSGHDALTWQGYADNAYDALNRAALAFESGDGPGEWTDDGD